MKINTKLYNLDFIISLGYSEIIQKLIRLEEIYSKLELDKRLLMFGFDDNDVEALQLIDAIELQQYYSFNNIKILKEALSIKEQKLLIINNCHGVITTIGLN